MIWFVEVGPPCWATGLACPSLDGLDPVREARTLVSEVLESVQRGSPIGVGVVDYVFSLVQLALDDRYAVVVGSICTGRKYEYRNYRERFVWCVGGS